MIDALAAAHAAGREVAVSHGTADGRITAVGLRGISASWAGWCSRIGAPVSREKAPCARNACPLTLPSSLSPIA